ncbi:chloramphenicol acetyltransferase [Oricola sp.]|uniref:chloramphenicol acetyltransferase n=1 Tax=Oricola sp. TaxID=1979950 RepID=UPI0025FF263D|nr:chloramphenicol acetyltransferase [Oricola sp.]MCI5074961.1 chloramphenicol acetyltransferase [Oricola sp.]
MAEREIDLTTWPRAEAFRFFRTFQRPQYSITSRLDVTRLVTELKPAGVSAYRACIYAIGVGIHAVPELRTRFRGDTVVEHDRVALSMTVPLANGGFTYGYVPFDPDWRVFDPSCAAEIAQAAERGDLGANEGFRDDVAYLSCLPWLDFTNLTNAMPGPDDCIPRVSWGKFTEDGWGRHSVAMTIEAHHALVDGRHLGLYFEAAQEAVNAISAL